MSTTTTTTTASNTGVSGLTELPHEVLKARPAGRDAQRQREHRARLPSGSSYPSSCVPNAFQRHQHYIQNYVLFYGGSKALEQFRPTPGRTDIDLLRETHKFIRDEEEGHEGGEGQAPHGGPRGDDGSSEPYEARLARKYYNRLFKEYAIADLSHYRTGKVGLRWRTEKEVIDGKGQFVCGNKSCSSDQSLASYEVNFGYSEHGERKNALVKIRLCPDCAYRLNYKKEKERKKLEARALARAKRRERKERKRLKKRKRHHHDDRHEHDDGDDDGDRSSSSSSSSSSDDEADDEATSSSSSSHSSKRRRLEDGTSAPAHAPEPNRPAESSVPLEHTTSHEGDEEAQIDHELQGLFP